MAISGALDNRLLDLADEIYEEGKADGFALGLIEGARQALDAAEIAAQAEMCDCGCGLTYDELGYLDDAFAEARDGAEGCDCEFCSPEQENDDTIYVALDDGVEIPLSVLLGDIAKTLTELVERQESVEEFVGLKYTG